MKVREALELGASKLKKAGKPTPLIDCQLLLISTLGKGWSKERLFADLDYKLTSKNQTNYLKLLERRLSDEPVALIIGRKEFYKWSFLISKSVLQPRPETEKIVDVALSESKKLTGSINILDVGTGCGCIAISLAKELSATGRNYKITATDVSKRAISIAKKNWRLLKEDSAEPINFIVSDLLKQVKKEKHDIVTANLPYIPEGLLPALEPEVLKEPKLALVGGSDGLRHYRKLRTQIEPYISKNSLLIFECSKLQEKELRELFFPYRVEIIV